MEPPSDGSLHLTWRLSKSAPPSPFSRAEAHRGSTFASLKGQSASLYDRSPTRRPEMKQRRRRRTPATSRKPNCVCSSQTNFHKKISEEVKNTEHFTERPT